jgi:hypothetical protein
MGIGIGASDGVGHRTHDAPADGDLRPLDGDAADGTEGQRRRCLQRDGVRLGVENELVAGLAVQES